MAFIASVVWMGAIIGILVSLKSVFRLRLRRVRMWNSAVKVLGSGAAGAFSGFGLASGIVSALPPSDWPSLHHTLFWTAILAVNTGTLGLMDGVVTGYLAEER